jgi:hypothetical protein
LVIIIDINYILRILKYHVTIIIIIIFSLQFFGKSIDKICKIFSNRNGNPKIKVIKISPLDYFILMLIVNNSNFKY